MKTKIEIKTFGGSVLFTYEAENNTTKKTLETAYLEGADLRGAYLRGAYLRGAYLRGAYLRGADLEGADLEGADLEGADLEGADLRGAYLRGADLRGAYLRGAKNLPQWFINLASRDLLFVFEHLKAELPGLRKALIEGRIDGTQYEGECACLIGTLGNLDGGVDKICTFIPFYDQGLHNPGENWFWNIRKGDTPKDNEFAKHALMLIDMVLDEKEKPVKKTKKEKGGEKEVTTKT